MAGTAEGGRKAALRNKLNHGAKFYANIGKKGGASSKTGGFASDKVGKDGLTGRQRASAVGRVGGKKSRRTI